MQHVVVTYYRKRNVYIDGNQNGKTNQTIRVEEGTHIFDLGPDPNYTPAFIKVNVTGSSPIKPMSIDFFPIKEEL